MALFYKISNNIKTLQTLLKVYKTVTPVNNVNFVNSCCISLKQFHSTPVKNDLMEFFDDKKNWGEPEIRSGRSWKLEELRIKSNTDLHKLWYVLLKEKNMLLTMEHECNEKAKLFPSPERLDKVNDSMKNLETVVQERNKAYHLLETGETGERPVEIVTNQFGLKYRYRQAEHIIPKEINTIWKKRHDFNNAKGNAVSKFLLMYREKLYNEKRKKRVRDKNHVMGLLRRFPNIDEDALKSQYPDVDIEKCKASPRARGHFVPK